MKIQHQKCCDTEKAVTRGQFVQLNAYHIKEKDFKLMIYFLVKSRKEQIKSKVSRKKEIIDSSRH